MHAPKMRAATRHLMGAAFKGHDEVGKQLLDEPCTVDQVNSEGRTALMFAALVGQSNVIRLLEQRGADRVARDVSGKTAVDWAATQGASLPQKIPALF